MEASLIGRLRPMIEDDFTDKETGEIIEYKQIQLESEDEKGRIQIDRVSINRKDWDSIDDIKKLEDNLVTVPCSITRTQTGMRTVLSGEVTKFHTAPIKAAS